MLDAMHKNLVTALHKIIKAEYSYNTTINTTVIMFQSLEPHSQDIIVFELFMPSWLQSQFV